MVVSTRLPSWIILLTAFLSLVLETNALYFYMDGGSPKCFYEELPKDTLVVGQSSGSYIVLCNAIHLSQS